jgi:hypothetical protein
MTQKWLANSVLAVWIATPLSSVAALASAPLSIVALTGQIAPGTGGARFSSLSGASMNTLGDLVFRAGLTSEVAKTGIFLFSHGELTLVALEGQAAPDLPDRTFGQLGETAINDNGEIVFDSLIKGASRRTEAIFLKSNAGIRKVVDTDTSAPGTDGQRFLVLRLPTINNRGDIAFQADLSGTVPCGLFLVSAGAIQTVVLGDQPIGGTNQIFGTFNPYFSLNNLGDIVFASLFGGGANTVFLYSAGVLSPIVQGSEPVPNATLVLDAKYQPWINDSREVVFVNGDRGFLPNALLKWRDGRLEKIAMTGDRIPHFESTPIGNDLGDVQIDNHGVISLRVRLYLSVAESREFVFALQNNEWSLIAREGSYLDPLGVFDFLGAVRRSESGRVSFLSNMTSGVAGLYVAALGSYKIYFPQLADGRDTQGCWKTTLVLSTRTSTESSVTVRLFDNSGSPLTVGVSGETASQYSLTIPPFGVRTILSDGTGPSQQGWALVESSERLGGIAVYSYFDTVGRLVSEVGVPASVDLTYMSFFAEHDVDTYTGIAIANPHDAATDVVLTLTDGNHATVGTRNLSIPANGHAAMYVTQLFDGVSIPAGFRGTVEATSSRSVVGLTLRQRELIFTSLPVMP